jgi:hypothetical protein
VSGAHGDLHAAVATLRTRPASKETRHAAAFRCRCDPLHMRKGEARAAAEILRVILRTMPFPTGVEAYRGHADALDPPKPEERGSLSAPDPAELAYGPDAARNH